MRWWETLHPEEERQVYEGTFRGSRLTKGKRPALIIVDVVKAFMGEPGETLADSTKEWPTSCGPVAWEALPHLMRLVDAAREAGTPVVFATPQAGADQFFGGTVVGEEGKMGSPMSKPGALELPPGLTPQPGELVMPKPKASAFFATPLLAHLHRCGVDSLIVTGTTTSGCVRATVVDGHSWGYPTFVVEEACFDRSRLSHGVNLYEMNAKYADVITVDETVAWLQSLPREAVHA